MTMLIYLADKKPEAEWAEIKNANSEKIKVRTSSVDGSPGRILLRSLWENLRPDGCRGNSRLLCRNSQFITSNLPDR